MSSLPARKIYKVLIPIERKDGKTHWLRVGTAFPNRDESINLYLDAMPLGEKKLQIRELDEEDLRSRDSDGSHRRESRGGAADHGGGSAHDDLPF